MLKLATEAQTASAVLMARPNGFAFNAETAETNSFAAGGTCPDLTRLALAEFDGLVRRLADAGVEVMVLDEPSGPDAVFPNNWISFHADGTAVLYPMATASRREERHLPAVQTLLTASGRGIGRLVDLTGHEDRGAYLEGTGSLVLDRPGRRGFACLGPRTDPAVIADFDRQLGYDTYTFDASGPDGRPIYHTNVLMSLGTRFAVVCLDPIEADDRGRLVGALEAAGRTVIPVDWSQLCHFACNILELRNAAGEALVALSSQALASLRPDQRRTLELLGGELVHADIPTIERVGGGGVRCMLAEVNLPRG